MADKDSTKLIIEAIDFYLTEIRKTLKPDTDLDHLKKIVRLHEVGQALAGKKDE